MLQEIRFDSRRCPSVFFCVWIVWAAAMLLPPPVQAAGPLTLTHIHGLSCSPDGTQLFIPSHHGLAIYSRGGWSPVSEPRHDDMGFSVTRESFYSSGHPAPGSALQNPFGLIKSRDGGRTWETLGLAGESDFHLLATSYETHAIYVYNPAPNSRMPAPGLYVPPDDGRQWQKAKRVGLSGRIFALAVHPTDAKRVAIGTADGLFLSRDMGDHFQPLVQGRRVLGLFFARDGQHLWWGGMAAGPTLSRLHWQTDQSVAIPLPPWGAMPSRISPKIRFGPKNGPSPRSNAMSISPLTLERHGSKLPNEVRRDASGLQTVGIQGYTFSEKSDA